jgi:hypothetical protein
MFGLLYPSEIIGYLFWQKNVFGYIFGKFSQTHLVTLLPTFLPTTLPRSSPLLTDDLAWSSSRTTFDESQCDQIGKNFSIWAKVFSIGRFFSRKKFPNDLGEILVE